MAADALLGQTYENFELIISDNASTDGTAGICNLYMKQDSRIRYIRQPPNIGAAPNHNFVAAHARGELIKWASADDLYAPELLERCIGALDEYPHIVLAHSWTALIDDGGRGNREDRVSAGAPPPCGRQNASGACSTENRGDDFYGVIRAEVFRGVRPQGSYHHADHTFVTDIALQGPFYQIPDWLFSRRDHLDRAERARPQARARCGRTWIHAGRTGCGTRAIRLYAEY